MEPVVRCGLIAGAISGEVIVLLVLVNTILIRNFSGPQGSAGNTLAFSIWNITYPLLVILIFEIGGIFSARLCRRHITPGKEALISGFITGISTGIILEIMWFSRIVSLVVRTGENPTGTAGFVGIVMTVGLLLILVIMGGVLSAFGSYIYATRTATKETAPLKGT
jgi:Na+-driven multidrug efflux pump